MTTHSLTQSPVSTAGLDRKADMREELIGVMVRHHIRRRHARRLGTALIVVVAVGAGAQIAFNAVGTGSAKPNVASKTTSETERTIVHRVEFVETSRRSIVVRIENVDNKVQMIDNAQLWQQLRQAGYSGGFIEIDGHVTLTQTVAANSTTSPRADTSS